MTLLRSSFERTLLRRELLSKDPEEELFLKDPSKDFRNGVEEGDVVA